jgi:hypothetical protein
MISVSYSCDSAIFTLFDHNFVELGLPALHVKGLPKKSNFKFFRGKPLHDPSV